MKDVKRVYGRGDNQFQALKGINVDIKQGESIAIVGRSGSGKSTLMHILTGMDKPTDGDVLANGESIFSLDTDTWRGQNIGIVFQQFFLQSNNSVLENVLLPLKIQGVSRKEREISAKKALEQVGLSDKVNSKANDLSGGQKQRVAIARALVTSPQVLVADEPTGNLDTENGEAIAQLLFDLNKERGATLVIITHDEELAERCSRVIRLKDGEIVSIKKGTSQKKRGAK
jgi:putative ABC transport system ATP-binding protein